MRHAIRPFLSLALLFLSMPAAWAGPITGRVVDPDGRPVRGATVLLVDGAAVLATTQTDSTGAFALTAPHDGPFELHASVEGLRGRPVPVRGEADAGTIMLEVSAVREAVLVSAAQVDIPLSTTSSSVTLLTHEDLDALQVHELADALRLSPGLAIAAAGGPGAQTSIFPRGGESDYSLVVIDGVQANAFGGGFDFAHVPVVNVEQIEIVRGPQSALYGSNAIGSVIRIVTKRGGPPSGSALFEAAGYGTRRAAGAASGGHGPWNWGGALDRVASDGMSDRRTPAGMPVENDDYGRWTASAGGGWSRPAGAGIRLDTRYTEDERGFPGPFGSDPGGTFSGIDLETRGRNERLLMSLSAAVPAGARARIQAQVTHARIDGSTESSFDDTFLFSRRTMGRVQADVTVAPSLDGSVGGEIQRERAGSTFITAGGSRKVPVERTLGGFFAEGRWHRASRLFVTAGVRAERIRRDALAGEPGGFSPRPDFSDSVITSVNPKLGAAWFVHSSGGNYAKIRASAGTGIRPPDAFEIAFTDNPDLKPERSRSVDAGVDLAFAGGRATLDATAFYNRYDDLVIAVGSFRGSSEYRTDNISNARARGLEVAGAVRARASLGVPVDVHLRASLTLLDTEILAVDGEAAAPPPFSPGDRLLRRPARQGSAELIVRAGRVSGFLTAGGRSGSRDVDPSFGTFGGLFDAPGYAVVHAGAAWRPIRQVEMFARVANLLDRRYEEALGFPALGRSATVGLRVAAGR